MGLFQRAGLILDCHVHLLPPRRLLKLIEWARRFFPGHPVPETIALEELLAEFEAQGIRALLNFAHAIFPDETDVLNRFNHELATRYPQVLPVGTLHPESPEPLLVVSQCLDEYGFLGLKFHAFVQKFLPWEPRMRPVYEAVAARGRLLYFHTGFEAFYGGPLPVAGWAELLAGIPPTPIVLAHACFPHFEAAFELLDRHPHLYLDIVNTLSPLAAMWLSGQDLEERRRVLREGVEAFPDRIMFGSDHPAGLGGLAQIYRDFDDFGLSDRARAALLGGTARRLIERVAPGRLRRL